MKFGILSTTRYFEADGVGSSATPDAPVVVAETPIIADPPAVAPVAETPPATLPDPEAPKPEGKRDWRETRIDQLTREKFDALRETERLKAIINAQPKTEGTTPEGLSEAEINRRAAILADQQKLNAKLKTWNDNGAKEFKDFNERCATVAGLGLAPTEKPAFIREIVDMDDGHRLVAHLADHPETAMELAKMPDTRMARELERLSVSLQPKPAPVSKAPAPVSAPTGAVVAERSASDPTLTMEQYSELRRAQRAAKKR